MINFNIFLNKWTQTINASCLSPLIELTNHIRSHSVLLSTAPKLEKCVTCRRSISKNQTHSAWNLLCLCHVYIFFSLFLSLCLVKLDDSRRYFCITQATRLWMVFFCLMCTKMYLKGLATESILFKQNHLYTFTIAWPFFSFHWNHERHEQRNRVTTVLGAKQEGLAIVHF